MIDYFKPNILSKKEELFDKIINSKIINMVRFAIESKEEFSSIYNISDNRDAFSLSEGALLIEFDNGISLAFNSDEEICSVISWAEKLDGICSQDLLIEDNELYPISASDANYSTKYLSDIINQKVTKYEIIKQEPFSATYYSLPREVGLILYFSNDSNIVISHQLTKRVSDSFTILDIEKIDKEIYPTLYKMSKFW